MKKNVIIRSISGIVYVAVFVGCILGGSIPFWALTEFLIAAGIFEYMRLMHKFDGENINIGLYVPVVIMALFIDIFAWDSLIWWFSMAWVGLMTFMFWPIMLCATVFLKSRNPVGALSGSLLALPYIALPMTLLNISYQMVNGWELILLTLIAIWVNDTGAFCVGCSIGKHKLCERLSPKKSWEGFWGGMGFVVVGMAIYCIVLNYDALRFFIYIVYGIIISVLATLGDLFESMLKRRAGVKDSGNIIPGHGGILDRIDSLLFVAYAVVVMSYCLECISAYYGN